MKFIKIFLKFIFILSAITLLLLYCIFLFVLPPVFSNSKVVSKIELIIKEKYNLNIKINDLKLYTYPNLSLKLFSKETSLQNKNEKALYVDNVNIYCNLFSKKLNKISSDYVFLNPQLVKEIFSSDKKSKKKDNISLNLLPLIDIKKMEIAEYNSETDYTHILIDNLLCKKEKNNFYINLNSEIKSSKLKNVINVNSDKNVYFNNNGFYADKLSVMFGNSKLQFDGVIRDKNKKSNLKIIGKNIPVSDIESSLLYFQKLKKKGKVFIENFYDFSGEIDVDLLYKDNGLFGECVTNKLYAKTVLFNVPVKFEKAVFSFNNRTIKSYAVGTIGEEKLHSSFELTDLATENQKVKGKVHSNLSDKIADKYIPYTGIKGRAHVAVDYTVEKGVINVDYLLKLAQGSDIFYKHANLGLENTPRRLYVQTVKYPDKLKIVSYDYSIVNDKEITNILTGEGLLQKENGHLALDYITCKTNGYAPVSVTGSFGKHIKGGFFDGSLKYNAKKEQVTGNFTVVESKYKNFYLKKAVITADEKNMKIYADGTYDNSVFNWDLTAKNDFVNKIHIYNMDLFLDELVVKDRTAQAKPLDINIPDAAEDIKIDIDNWQIRMNKISKNRIVVTNIKMFGSLKNEIFKFTMPSVNFAKGILSAKGRYNFANNSASVDFVADNINSNIVADVLFNLPDQIHGYASANFHAETGADLKNIKAHADFEIKDGYLLKLGSTEFMIKKSRKLKRPIKIRISDIINVDINKSKALSSNLKGSFDIDNFDMKNVELTSQQKYLSILIEGDYDIKKQDANLKLWGKYNKSAEKGIKIMFVPLSWIIKVVFRPEKTMDLYKDKIKEVPSVISKPEDEQAFRVKMKGNLNNNNVKVELKRIF